ncbi:hypothetical protein HMI54_010462 [Coelomomyces lativittatus]|nr:hypothetical protein HMI54_010462 [Coelomomyces lativittatus]
MKEGVLRGKKEGDKKECSLNLFPPPLFFFFFWYYPRISLFFLITFIFPNLKYTSGQRYFELECETSDPDYVKPKLLQFLDSHNIQYSNSTMNKFAIMRHEASKAST